MGMRAAGTIGMCGLLALATLGCTKVSKDTSKVIASVGGEKVTEQAFQQTVRTWVGDSARANDLLTSQALRGQRNQFLGSMLNQRALLQMVKAQGLDKDPKVKLQVESAVADAYFQILADRLAPKGEPTEAQLQAFWDDYVKQAKMLGQDKGLPTYDQVKPQLPKAYKEHQAETIRQTLVTELNEKYPPVVDPDYRSVQMP